MRERSVSSETVVRQSSSGRLHYRVIVLNELRSERLLLRRWRASDLDPFAAMNADARVMEVLSAHAHPRRDGGRHRENGRGVRASRIQAPFIGFVGLSVPSFDTHFMPCVEIGWRVAFEHWNRGYATEAARVALAAGFERFGLSEIVAFTVPANRRSRRVMEKIGMTYDPADDFDYPTLPEGHPPRRHVLYRIKNHPESAQIPRS